MATQQNRIMFTNLLFLGFDPIAMERKWRIPFNMDMFLLPNKKGFETVVHFLFNALNPVQCREEFRDCWPVNDKKCEQQFRRVCNSWLTQIVKEDDEAVFPRIVASVFLSPGGDKLCELLFYFSSYVIMKVVKEHYNVKKRDYLQHHTLTSQTQNVGDIMDNMAACAVTRVRSEFQEQVENTTQVHSHWKQHAVELVKTHRNLTKTIRDKERAIRAAQQKNAELNNFSNVPNPLPGKRRSVLQECDYDIMSVKRSQKVQKVRGLWRSLDEFVENHKEEQEIVDSILQATLDKYKLDATELDVKVPDILLTQYQHELQRRNVDNIFEGGKLNLLSLIHLWNLSLHMYIAKLHEGLPSFDEVLPSVTTHIHTNNAHLTNVQSLRLSLEMDVLPELKKSVKSLRDKLNDEVLEYCSPESIRTTSLGLGLLPPTPPVSFEPDDGRKSGDDTGGTVPLVENLKMPKDQISTPEAATELMEHISKTVRGKQRQASLLQGSPTYGPKVSAVLDRKQTSKQPSKLPVKGRVAVEKVGSVQRTRFTPGSSKRAEPKGVADEVFKVPAATIRGRKPSGKVQDVASSQAEHHQKVANAHEVLADQIAASILAPGSPSDDASFLQDPIRQLESDAFQSRDKLGRTPSTKERKNTGWGNMLHDSVGPLSSTRVEHYRPSIDHSFKDELATKLFSPEHSDTEDFILTMKATSDTALPSGSSTRIHQYVPDLSRVHAASPIGIHPPSSISSISPQSDGSRNSRKAEGKIHSTLLNDLELEERPDLMDEIHDISDPFLEDLSSSGAKNLKTQGKFVLGFVSPSNDIRPDQENGNDSTLKDIWNTSNNNIDNGNGLGDMDEMLTNLHPAQEVYQSLLETETPLLPKRTKTCRPEAHHSRPITQGLEHHSLSTSRRPDTIIGQEAMCEDDNTTEDGVCVIEFKDGSFSQFIEESPTKLINLSPQHGKMNGDVHSPPSRSLKPEVKSPLQTIKEKLDQETDSIIERYRQLKEATAKEQSKAHQEVLGPVPSKSFEPLRTERDFLDATKPKALPLISETPTHSFMDSYMKVSPPPGKYGGLQYDDSEQSQSIIVNKFTLDLDSDDD